MKLLIKITSWLAAAFTILLAVWAVCFYFATMDEINDETDDSLIDYSDGLIIRKLSGVELPSEDNGTNNTYYIKEVPAEYAVSRPWIVFEYQEVFISSKSEFESARVLSRIFKDNSDRYYELTVAVPTIEKEDIQRSILWWVIALYIILLSQSASLLVTMLRGAVPAFPVPVFLSMVCCGILGGALGRRINRRLDDRTVNRLFFYLLLVIMGICCYNVFRYSS